MLVLIKEPKQQLKDSLKGAEKKLAELNKMMAELERLTNQ